MSEEQTYAAPDEQAPATHYEESAPVDPSFTPEGAPDDGADHEGEGVSPSDLDYGQGQEEYAESEADDEPDDPEAERIARLMGWKPKEEWKGDTTNFVKASEYLKRNARKFEAVEELERKTQELDELKRKFVEYETRLDRDQDQRETATIQQLEAQRNEAFRIGDAKAFQALDQEIRKRERQRVEAEIRKRQQQAEQGPAYDPDADVNFHKFQAQNSWYGDRSNATNQAKTYYAEKRAAPQAYAEGLRPEVHGEAFYQRVAELVNEVYGQPSTGLKNMPSQNNSRQPAKPRAPKSKGFSHLPQDAHQAFERLSRKGVFSNDEKGRAEYARLYFEENAE